MFKFRLLPVLKYRKRQEEEKMRELAVINAEMVGAREEIERFQEDRRNAAQELTEIAQTVEKVNTIRLYEDFINGRDSDIAFTKRRLEQIGERLDSKQKELLEYVRRRRVMEIYRDRLKTAYDEEEARKERREDDEAANRTWFREAL